jgi:hypothetical protein
MSPPAQDTRIDRIVGAGGRLDGIDAGQTAGAIHGCVLASVSGRGTRGDGIAPAASCRIPAAAVSGTEGAGPLWTMTAAKKASMNKE